MPAFLLCDLMNRRFCDKIRPDSCITMDLLFRGQEFNGGKK